MGEFIGAIKALVIETGWYKALLFFGLLGMALRLVREVTGVHCKNCKRLMRPHRVGGYFYEVCDHCGYVITVEVPADETL